LINLNPVGKENGAFAAKKFDHVPFSSIIFLERDDQELPPGVKGRIKEEEMLKFVPKDDHIIHEGPIGDAIFVDTGSCYHM